MNEKEYLQLNKESWNLKTGVHYDSAFYDNDNFIKGKNSLKPIEIELMGDVSGKSLLHLQCHFGQDSISFGRLGAQVTGVDFSDQAIDKAIHLNQLTNQEVEFICSDIYSLQENLKKKYDIVFTSYGTICWLPDLRKWAQIVSHFLKPGGSFYIAEFHPVVWMYDDDFKGVMYSYFNKEAIKESFTGTYTDRDADIEQNIITWNHPLSDVVNYLIASGLEIRTLNEYDYSPADCFNNTIEVEKGKYRIKSMGDKIPMVYAIHAVKK